MRIKKILIISDNNDLSLQIIDFLKKKDYNIYFTNDNDKGFEICKKENPSLIIVNLFMAHGFGIKFLEQTRNDNELSLIPVIIMPLVSKQNELNETVFCNAMEQWMNKPFDFDMFFSSIEKIEDKIINKELNKIAIIEDDMHVAESIANILDIKGYNTLIYNSKEKLAERIASDRPFLIMIDILSSNIDSIELIQQLRRNPETNKIYIYVVSSFEIQGYNIFVNKEYSQEISMQMLLDELHKKITKYEFIKIQKHAKVLVADANPKMAALTMSTLRAQGIETIYASDVEKAISLIYQEMPDLILLDSNLSPNKDSFHVYIDLKSDILISDLPIILMIDSPAIGDKICVDENVGEDYITKPYDLKYLITRVNEALKNSSSIELNPLTRLPGSVYIEKIIIDCIKNNLSFAVLYIDINNFKLYNNLYGFDKGDHVIRELARVILTSLKELDFKEEFIAHLGGDDFIVVTLPDRVDELCSKIIFNFTNKILTFYNEEDKSRGYIIIKDRQNVEKQYKFISLAIGVATTKTKDFSSLGEVSKIGVEMKAYAKNFKEQGSYYSVDERKNKREI